MKPPLPNPIINEAFPPYRLYPRPVEYLDPRDYPDVLDHRMAEARMRQPGYTGAVPPLVERVRPRPHAIHPDADRPIHHTALALISFIFGFIAAIITASLY